MRAIIVDDERLARAELKGLLAAYPSLTIVEEFENGKDALAFLKKEEVDVVFLDMEMPEMSGLDVAAKIDSSEVVFVTAHADYAIEAFDVNATDYLLKPVQSDKLDKTIEKLQKQIEEYKDLESKVLGLEDKIFIKDGEKCWFTPLSEVRYFQSEGNYAKVMFGDQKPMVLRSLNSLEKKLDTENFFRASRKHIININHISSIEVWFSGGLAANMSDGVQVEISRRQAVKFKHKYGI